MQIITSKDNEIIKNVRKLKEKKYRDLNNEYIVEGVKMIREAILEEAKIKLIVAPTEGLGRLIVILFKISYDKLNSSLFSFMVIPIFLNPSKW